MRSRLRLPQDGNLLKGQRLDSYLFLELAHERVSRRFAALAVPPNDVPHIRVEGPTLRALCQKNLVATHQKTTGTGPHRASPAANASALVHLTVTLSGRRSRSAEAVRYPSTSR